MEFIQLPIVIDAIVAIDVVPAPLSRAEVAVTTLDYELAAAISSLSAMPFLKAFDDLSTIKQFDSKNFTK